MLTKAMTIGAMFVLLNIMGATAAEADIHTMAHICQPAHLPLLTGEGFIYGSSGISVPGATSVNIICAVPRPDLPANGTATFIIDGINRNGTSTGCGVEIVSSSGVFKSIESFTLSGTSSRVTVSLPSTRVTNTDHVFIFCLLPPNAGGSVVGFTAVGP